MKCCSGCRLVDSYDDGPFYSLDWTNPGILTSAISQGPVKIGIARLIRSKRLGDRLTGAPDGLLQASQPILMRITVSACAVMEPSCG
jgi:hypothetical protein